MPGSSHICQRDLQSKFYSTIKEISQIWMLQLTYIKESNHSTSLILLTTAQRERERVSVWIEINATFSFPRFFFFFIFLCMNSNHTWVHCLRTVYHYLYTVYVLKNIKNGSHSIIHTFKNYFATVLSVFSFQISISPTINSIQTDPETFFSKLGWIVIWNLKLRWARKLLRLVKKLLKAAG